MFRCHAAVALAFALGCSFSFAPGCAPAPGPRPARQGSAPLAEPAAITADYARELAARLRAARAVRVEAEAEGPSEPFPGQARLELDGLEGTWRFSMVDGGVRHVGRLEMEHDGAVLRWEEPRAEPSPIDDPPSDLRDFVALELASSGAFWGVFHYVIGQGMRSLSDGHACCWVELGDGEVLGSEEVNGRGTIVVRTPLSSFQRATGHTTVWVDAETATPVRREVVRIRGDEELRSVERYSRFEIVPAAALIARRTPRPLAWPRSPAATATSR